MVTVSFFPAYPLTRAASREPRGLLAAARARREASREACDLAEAAAKRAGVAPLHQRDGPAAWRDPRADYGGERRGQRRRGRRCRLYSAAQGLAGAQASGDALRSSSALAGAVGDGPAPLCEQRSHHSCGSARGVPWQKAEDFAAGARRHRAARRGARRLAAAFARAVRHRGGRRARGECGRGGGGGGRRGRWRRSSPTVTPACTATRRVSTLM